MVVATRPESVNKGEERHERVVLQGANRLLPVDRSEADLGALPQRWHILRITPGRDARVIETLSTSRHQWLFAKFDPRDHATDGSALAAR